MGYRGKVREQEAARELRALGWTLADIAEKLEVAKSSVSLWVRDVEFTPSPRRRARRRGPNILQRRKAAEIEALDLEGAARFGDLNEQAFLAAGAALYAGEGAKRDGVVKFANSDPAMMAFFCAWLRRFFDIDEARLRVTVYLHEGLDLAAAETFWSDVTRVPESQFRKAYRATPDPSIRTNKHEHGCAYVHYGCARTHRAIMGLIRALLSSEGHNPG
jgi:transcriptional regulator with XRE-family HTH domain